MSFGRIDDMKKAHIVFTNGEVKAFNFKSYMANGDSLYFYDCMNYPGEECIIIVNTRNVVSVTITSDKND